MVVRSSFKLVKYFTHRRISNDFQQVLILRFPSNFDSEALFWYSNFAPGFRMKSSIYVNWQSFEVRKFSVIYFVLSSSCDWQKKVGWPRLSSLHCNLLYICCKGWCLPFLVSSLRGLSLDCVCFSPSSNPWSSSSTAKTEIQSIIIKQKSHKYNNILSLTGCFKITQAWRIKAVPK